MKRSIFGLLCCIALTTTSVRAAEPVVTFVTIPCTILDVHDGDTANVEVLGIVVSVRLLDCWSPELSEKGGTEATAALVKLCPKGAEATLSVPMPAPRRDGKRHLSDAFTFGRLLGRLTVKGTDVSKQMVKDGFSTTTKQH